MTSKVMVTRYPAVIPYTVRMEPAENAGLSHRRQRVKDIEKQARQKAAPIQEQKPVKRDFEKAGRLPADNPAPHPTERKFVSAPAPAPSPAGVPPMTERKTQDVPKVERKPEPQAKPATPVRDYWNDRAKATQAPAPAPSQPANEPKPVRDYWNDRAKAADERKPKDAPRRDRSKDRDFDRER